MPAYTFLKKTDDAIVPYRQLAGYWAAQVGTTRKEPWRLSKNTTVAKALLEMCFVKTLGSVLPG